jgi:hypothetical protein
MMFLPGLKRLVVARNARKPIADYWPELQTKAVIGKHK